MNYNSRMAARPSVWSHFNLLNMAAYLTTGAVAIVSFLTIEEPASQWLALGLVIAFAAVMFFLSERVAGWGVHAYFAAQTALAIGLLALEPNASAASILFFILSAQVMFMMPLRAAALWIVAFALITLVGLVIAFGWVGFAVILPYAGGYSFFGAFGTITRTAQQARAESQRLLEELRAAQDRLQQLAVAEERNRLARELHDSLGHRLTVAVVQLEGAQRLIPTDPERAGRMIGAMREQMKEALGDLRRTVATLRTPLEDDLPLNQSLRQLAHGFQEATGLPVQLSLPAELPPLSEAQRLALYRAAQETLTNAQRHARAHNVQLTLTAANSTVTLTTTDDGQGLPADLNGGFGMKGLQERAAQLGGECTVENQSEGGAQVRFTLPLKSSDDGRPLRATDDGG